MSEPLIEPSDVGLASILLVLGALIVYLLAPVLSPFFLSAIVAYFAQPIIHFFEYRRLPRSLGVLVFFLILSIFFFITAVIILPILQDELTGLITATPDFLEKLRGILSGPAKSLLGVQSTDFDLDQVKSVLFANWREFGSFANFLLSKIGRSGQYLLEVISYLFLVPLVTFYLMRDWHKVLGGIESVCPQRFIGELRTTASEVDAVLSEFLRGQMLIMLCLGLFYAIGLQILGVKYAFLIGSIAGLVSFIPYFGVIVGLSLASFVGFGQFDHYSEILKIVGIFGLGQLVESMILSPVLVGERIGLHPLWVILAVIIGGHLFGFSGILLALPVAAIIVVMLRRLRLCYSQP